jgi:hypothetical protein
MPYKARATSFFRNRKDIIALALAFIAAYITFPSGFILDIWPMDAKASAWASLDPSWNLALSYANIKQLTWGTDFIFTYGPLATLCTRVDLEGNRIGYLLFDLFVFINYFAVFFIAMRQSKNTLVTFLSIAAVVIILPFFVGPANSITLMLLLVYWICQSIDNPKPVYYVFQIALLTLLFFIKFNTGLIVFILYFAGLGYNFIKGKSKIWILILLPFFIIWLVSQLLNVAILPYIRSGFEMVEGYNDVMYLSNPVSKSYTYFAIIVALQLIVFAANFYKHEKKDRLKTGVSLFIMLTATFVLYKQSFVRADDGHTIDFFRYTPLLLFCNFDLHRHFRNKIMMLPFIAALSLPFYYLIKELKKPPVIEEKFSKKVYVDEFLNFTPNSPVHLYAKGAQLPAAIKQKIGTATVDVYPWNIQMLIENQLNYLPRPICQSYTAYTPYLENTNFEHYNDRAKAPEFVVYEYCSTDERYALFDESKVNLALYSNYFIAAKFELSGRKLLLLQKKADYKPIRFIKTREFETDITKPLVLKEGFYYEIETQHSMAGKMSNLFEHGPEISLQIHLKNSEIKRYRTSRFLLQSGIFSNSFLENYDDSAAFFGHKPQFSQIAFYRLAPFNKDQFRDTIQITEYRIEQ